MKVIPSFLNELVSRDQSQLVFSRIETPLSSNAGEDGQAEHGLNKNFHVYLGSFARARQVYTAVVRPAMTYGSIVWHTPKDVNRNKSITSKLAVIQKRCLRTVAGAFKATPILVLEAETHIAPIDVYLDQLQAKARYRLRITDSLTPHAR